MSWFDVVVVVENKYDGIPKYEGIQKEFKHGTGQMVKLK